MVCWCFTRRIQKTAFGEDIQQHIEVTRAYPERFVLEPAKGYHIHTRHDEYENQGFEFEPARGYHIRTRHDEYENLELLGELYDLASRGSDESTGSGRLYSSPILKKFRSPMNNTMLHVASLHGNDDMVDRVVAQYPNLLFYRNNNQDTPLHVAARAGHIPTLIKLLEACARGDYSNVTTLTLLEMMELKNNQGNTLLHEAMMSGCGDEKASTIFQHLQANDAAASNNNNNNVEGIGSSSSSSWSRPCIELLLCNENNEGQTVLHLAVEARLEETVSQILEKCPESATPMGISPLVAAIMMRDKGMLTGIVNKKQEWIHLADMNERLPLHCASSIGYHDGVVYLLEKCKTCSIKRDKCGLLPLHVAARGGHVEVVKELLRHCLDPNEMLDNDLSNILHIAAKSGKLDVVRYILQTPALKEMINQKDVFGDTPLHVATSSCHPKIVYALTWDHRVDINAVNQMNKTPLDIALENYGSLMEKHPLQQTLTWVALKSAAAKRSPRHSLKTAPNPNISDVSSTDRYKDRVDSLSVISALVVTASVAACFAVPGEAEGTANNLHKAMFHVFTFCITISLFSSISATIMLIWGRLGMIELLNFAIKWAMPLIGAALITLSLAFLAGVYTVISKLTWLATTFVVITAIFVAILCVQYIFLVLPSSSTWKFLRYISYYPFIFLASLAEERKP